MAVSGGSVSKVIQVTGPGRRRAGKGGAAKGFAGPTRSEINEIIADAYANMVLHWHTNFRPKHFTEGGAREYNYAPRSRKYKARKRKKYGHSNPLQFTGESKRLSESYTLFKSRNGARVRMPVRTFNRRPAKFTGNMGREFTATSDREIKIYGILTRRYLKQRLAGQQVTIQVNL